jgi:quercetin dioxygenase-like cupin family protein
VGHVVAGRLRFRIGDEERELAPGDGYAIPGGLPHGCVAIGNTVAIDSFTPVREDYR